MKTRALLVIALAILVKEALKTLVAIAKVEEIVVVAQVEVVEAQVEVVVTQVEVVVAQVEEEIKEVVQMKVDRVVVVEDHLVILLVSKAEILEVAVEDLKNVLKRQDIRKNKGRKKKKN